MSVVLRPAAVDDLRAAHLHYTVIGPDLADGFAAEFESVLERLEMFPLSGRAVEGVPEVRRARMRRFPYGVFYVVSRQRDVTILRVLHSARDAGQGLEA